MRAPGLGRGYFVCLRRRGKSTSEGAQRAGWVCVCGGNRPQSLQRPPPPLSCEVVVRMKRGRWKCHRGGGFLAAGLKLPRKRAAALGRSPAVALVRVVRWPERGLGDPDSDPRLAVEMLPTAHLALAPGSSEQCAQFSPCFS